MISEELKTVPSGECGVYCLYDLDDEPAYTGKTDSSLRRRLREHFIRQDSSVVSYGRLDIWDIHRVEWWETEDTDEAEQLLLTEYEPYLNFEEEHSSSPPSMSINLNEPDGVFELITQEELEFRSEPYNRSKQKLEHLMRMIDKIRLAGHSEETRKTVYEHQRILQESMSMFLGIDDANKKSEETAK
jgi:excinuclease UvrABC nuclease subunit